MRVDENFESNKIEGAPSTSSPELGSTDKKISEQSQNIFHKRLASLGAESLGTSVEDIGKTNKKDKSTEMPEKFLKRLDNQEFFIELLKGKTETEKKQIVESFVEKFKNLSPEEQVKILGEDSQKLQNDMRIKTGQAGEAVQEFLMKQDEMKKPAERKFPFFS